MNCVCVCEFEKNNKNTTGTQHFDYRSDSWSGNNTMLFFFGVLFMRSKDSPLLLNQSQEISKRNTDWSWLHFLDLHFIAAFVLSLNNRFTFNETVAHSGESKGFEIRDLMQILIQALSSGLISCFSFSIWPSNSFIYLNFHKHLLNTFLCTLGTKNRAVEKIVSRCTYTQILHFVYFLQCLRTLFSQVYAMYDVIQIHSHHIEMNSWCYW